MSRYHKKVMNQKRSVRPNAERTPNKEEVADLLSIVRDVEQKEFERRERNEYMKASKSQSERHVVRGEIYYIVPNGEIGSELISSGGRPAIIVSNDMTNALDGTVEVVYLTRHPWYSSPTNVDIYATGQKSTALCNQISTVSKNRLGKFINQCSEHELERLDNAMSLSIGLNLNEITMQHTIDILEEWKGRIAKHPCEYELDDTADDMDDKLFEGFDEELEPAPVAVKVHDKSVPDVKTAADLVSDITSHPVYLKLQAEKEMLQNMYNELLKKIMEG